VVGRMEIKPKDVERFWKKVNKEGPIVYEELGPCWEWAGVKANNGYGLFNLRINKKAKQITAHRLSYMIANNLTQWPDGLLACHKCDNKICVRSDHIFLGTPTDNMQDAVKKGRIARGEKTGAYTHPEQRRVGELHGQAIVTWEIVRELRRIYDSLPKPVRRGVSKAVRERFGLKERTYNSIVKREHWKEEQS